MTIDWDFARRCRDEVSKWPAWKQRAARAAFQQPQEEEVTDQPIKLTDEIINSILLHPDRRNGLYTAELQHAIRALRDRARAVVDAYESREDAHPGSFVWCARMTALDELSKVLP